LLKNKEQIDLFLSCHGLWNNCPNNFDQLQKNVQTFFGAFAIRPVNSFILRSPKIPILYQIDKENNPFIFNLGLTTIFGFSLKKNIYVIITSKTKVRSILYLT
jgi:hypothetical protein